MQYNGIEMGKCHNYAEDIGTSVYSLLSYCVTVLYFYVIFNVLCIMLYLMYYVIINVVLLCYVPFI